MPEAFLKIEVGSVTDPKTRDGIASVLEALADEVTKTAPVVRVA